jgi:poly(ADP-ribose) glycohydrolase ARH3
MVQSQNPAAFSYQRLAGAALGEMCGDALGMPVEGWPAEAISRRFGRLDELLPGRLPAGSYTDDSQMMIAILETLALTGGLDGPCLARRFREGYEPHRGYGGRIHGVMENLGRGAAWDQAGTDSFGNGGAMRVGVVGAFFPEDEEACRRAALDQCRITHTHPRGLAGAAALALAAARACRAGAQGREPAEGFAAELAASVEDLDPHTAHRLRAMPDLARGDEEACRRALTQAYACDVTAPEAVPPAVGAFLGAADAEQAVVIAVSLGGDTDTIGALAGAFWGAAGLPPRWLEALENGPRGRDYVLGLCRQAAAAKSG